jgi:hypothetical protein
MYFFLSELWESSTEGSATLSEPSDGFYHYLNMLSQYWELTNGTVLGLSLCGELIPEQF